MTHRQASSAIGQNCFYHCLMPHELRGDRNGMPFGSLVKCTFGALDLALEPRPKCYPDNDIKFFLSFWWYNDFTPALELSCSILVLKHVEKNIRRKNKMIERKLQLLKRRVLDTGYHSSNPGWGKIFSSVVV